MEAQATNKQQKRYRLGDLLVFKGVITEQQLEKALEYQRKYGKWLGDCLIELGLVRDSDIADVLEVQLGIPRVDLRGMRIDPEIINLVSGGMMRKHNVLPLSYSDTDSNVLILAMSNPLDMVAQDDISIITNCLIEPCIATIGEINAVIDRYFGTNEAMLAAEKYSKEREVLLASIDTTEADNQSEAVDNAPIVQLVRSIVEQAVRQRASDIHFDVLEKQIRIRYRIDGVLIDKMFYEIDLLPAIVTRIKIMSGMDISERRKPQDGHMDMTVDRNEYDIRVSTIPTMHGEKTVMRLASSKGITRSKSDLGMQEHELQLFEHILSNPNGIILVTGPTGSGKTTTLYASLNQLNTPKVNIVTVEDPVEANVPGINQVQVNPKANLTFASSLRSILRQDPDIIMIGEIRDRETASIAVQASITGHLVISTLHTNSSAATITRLLEMEVEPYLLADSIVGIIAQRLVRRLCTTCRKPRQATEHEKITLGVPEHQQLTIYEAGGCSRCGDTGYYDRIGVYEIMEIGSEMKRIITEQGTTEQLKKTAVASGMRTLHQTAADYVVKGITTLEEMRKVSIEY